MSRRIRVVIEYDGTAYSGWQVQANGEQTIQDQIERAIEAVTGERLRVFAAGRTDAGVHARGQVAHFDTDCTIPSEKMAAAINSRLPDDITILSSVEAAADFDARRAARGKIYQYSILNRPMPSPLLRHRSWHIKNPLDIEAMQQAAEFLIGEHDFASFQASGCAAKHTMRHIYLLDIRRIHDERILVEIFATAYLKQMVRNIVGTLVQVGLGQMPAEHMRMVLSACDRNAAGPTAPAQGLQMVKVFYRDDPPPAQLLRLIPESHRLM